MKSLAKRLLEGDKAAGTDLLTPPAGAEPDLPGDTTPAKDQPDEEPGQKELIKLMELMDDPDKMAGCIDEMCSKMEAYFDAADDSTYTVGDQQDKDDLTAAKTSMQEAAMKMIGKKRK